MTILPSAPSSISAATTARPGYLTTQGQEATAGFDDYNKGVHELRTKVGAGLTLSQSVLFNRAVDRQEVDAQRGALRHRAGELKKFIVGEDEKAAENFKTLGVQNFAQPDRAAAHLAEGIALVDGLGAKLGWGPEVLKAKRDSYTSDFHAKTATTMAQQDPVAALDYVARNLDALSPEDRANTLASLGKPGHEAVTRDALEHRAAMNAAAATAGPAAAATGTGVAPAVGGAAPAAGGVNAGGTPSTSAGVRPGVTGTVGDVIDREAAAAGVDANMLRRFAKIESGGNAGAVTGSYKGLFQMSDAEFAKYGGGDIFNPTDNARAAARKIAAEAAEFRSKYGRDPTPTDLYMQHQQGVAGYGAHLSNPTAPAWQNMASTAEGRQKGDAWAKLAIWGNIPDKEKARFGSVENVTSADFVAMWQNRVEGSGANPVTFSARVERTLSALPAEYATRLRESATHGVAQADTALAAQVKAQRLALVDDYKLRIATEDAALTRDEIMADARLDAGKKAELINSFTSKFGETLQTQRDLEAFKAGGFAIDPYSSDGKSRVDRAWTKLAGSVEDQDQRVALLGGVVEQAGVVPQPVVNAMRGALASGNLNNIAEAATLAVRLHALNSAALERATGGNDVRDAAVMFDHLVNGLGYDKATAARTIAEARDPKKVRELDALMKSEPVKSFIDDQSTENKVRDLFDKGVFGGFDPKLGDTPAQSAAMLFEYNDILKRSIYTAGGNTDLAKSLAADQFKRVYAPSEFSISRALEADGEGVKRGPATPSGGGVVMRLPVELTYPKGADGTHGYVRDQAMTALKGAGVSARDVYFVPDVVTDQDAERKATGAIPDFLSHARRPDRATPQVFSRPRHRHRRKLQHRACRRTRANSKPAGRGRRHRPSSRISMAQYISKETIHAIRRNHQDC